MEERIRVAAIIVKEGKLLLVKGSDKFKEYWTPGGKLEQEESELECLERELREEIKLDLVSAKFFKEYRSKSPYFKNVITVSKVYLVGVRGEIKPSKEINSFVWMSRNDFEKIKYDLIDVTRKKIIPDLIKEEHF